MRTIWKFPFAVEGEVVLRMPKGARALSVQTQNEVPCVWALVESTAAVEPRRFRIFGTGQRIEGQSLVFVGTFQQLSGTLVFHLFEVS